MSSFDQVAGNTSKARKGHTRAATVPQMSVVHAHSVAKTPSRELSRVQIAQLISQGHVLVIHHQFVYRLNSWLAKHPGGSLAILHFVGRDAACEIEAYHSSSALARMPTFCVARVASHDLPWKPITPPVQLGWPVTASSYASVPPLSKALDNLPSTFLTSPSLYPLPEQGLEPPEPPKDLDPAVELERAKAWKRLQHRLEDAGLFEPTPLMNYRYELLRYSFLFVLFLYSFSNASSTWQYLISAVLLGILVHQLTFVVHDACHTEITGVHWKDRLIAILIADFIGGLSAGWWCDNHDVHHLVTNHTDHDPDIQHLPFFAITTDFFNNKFSTYYQRVLTWDLPARYLVPVQHYLYYIVMFFARFNLFANSYAFLWFKARRDGWFALELMGVAVYWGWFGGIVLRSIPGFWTRLAFVILCFGAASPVHVQIVLSHFARDTKDWGLYESFPRRQLRTTMDVTCHPNLDFLHGGLNFQVTHHLFPRLPRHNLRPATEFVKQFCQEQDMSYDTWEFTEGNKMVCGVLADVARQCNVLLTVAKAQAETISHT